MRIFSVLLAGICLVGIVAISRGDVATGTGQYTCPSACSSRFHSADPVYCVGTLCAVKGRSSTPVTQVKPIIIAAPVQ